MMEIKNDVFYLLKSETKKWLFENEDQAIAELKKQGDTENTSILKVDTSENSWEITQVPCFDVKDQAIAKEMFENLKYLFGKYRWLEVYECAWRTMANKMCGNVEGRCSIIFNIKQSEYQKLREETKHGN
jgi:hypothetical protein